MAVTIFQSAIALWLTICKGTLHLENQERAYNAASRRTDHSLEARYQPALMASEVHKKRTGKNLHITPQIVENEDMYEEQDLGLPQLEPSPAEMAGRRRMSQADAFIAAMIARRPGMGPDTQYSSPAWMLAGSNAAASGPCTALYPSAPAKPTTNNNMFDGQPRYSTDLTPETDFQTQVGSDGDAAAQLLYWPLYRPANWTLHRSSNDSSLTDFSSCLSVDTNVVDPYETNSNSEQSSLRLEECLADADSEALLTMSQNGLSADCDGK